MLMTSMKQRKYKIMLLGSVYEGISLHPAEAI